MRLTEVLQQMDDRDLMCRHDPRDLANLAWSLETFGEDKHPKRRKKHARAGRPSKRATALAEKRKPLRHKHKSKRKRKSHKHPT
jgi:hypothetical protein